MSIFRVFFLVSLLVFPIFKNMSIIGVAGFNSNQVQPPINGCTGNSNNNNKSTTVEDGFKLVPLIDHKKGETMMMKMVMNESRRKLGSFQVCAPCTCCDKKYCLPYPCCYAINCNIPGKPFGFCSFTPTICNCFGCHA